MSCILVQACDLNHLLVPKRIKMYLLIHTMTITESDCVIQAQFFHAVCNDAVQVNDFKLVGRRLSLRIHPNLRVNRNKLNLQRLNAPNLKTLMKRNALHIKHQVRAIHMYVEKIFLLTFTHYIS